MNEADWIYYAEIAIYIGAIFGASIFIPWVNGCIQKRFNISDRAINIFFIVVFASIGLIFIVLALLRAMNLSEPPEAPKWLASWAPVIAAFIIIISFLRDLIPTHSKIQTKSDDHWPYLTTHELTETHKAVLNGEQETFLFKLNDAVSKRLSRPDPTLSVKMFSKNDKEMLDIARSLEAQRFVKIENNDSFVRITPEGMQYMKENLSNKELKMDLTKKELLNDATFKELPDGSFDLATTEYLIDKEDETLKRKQRRGKFICEIYRHVDGNTSVFINNIYPTAMGWGFEREEIESYVSYFSDKGFLKASLSKNRWNAGVWITDTGVDYVESLDCAKFM